jgi:glutamyl-tRNA reductase
VQVVCVGLSHRTAPIDVRERLALDDSDARRLAASLLEHDAIAEVFALSTCNRTELYTYAEDPDAVRALALNELSCRATPEALEQCAYTRAGREAILHLFRVASGLDSMVIGEAQILAQLKSAYRLAAQNATLGVVLDRLVRHALETGKRVRTQTGVGCGAVSVSSAAVALAERVFGTLDACVALVLGAGETSELTATHLKSHGVQEILISNRTFEASEHLAERFGGQAVPWGALEDHVRAADIVISSTAAPHYVLTRSEVDRVMRSRGGRPLFFIDIAVPRDCDPEIGDLDGVHLYDIDDLHGVVERNRGEREREAQAAERIVSEETEKAEAQIAGLEVVPTIVALRAEVERIRAAELARTLRRMGAADPRALQEAEALSRRLANKILHSPASRLTELATRDDAYLYVHALRQVFALDELVSDADDLAAPD